MTVKMIVLNKMFLFVEVSTFDTRRKGFFRWDYHLVFFFFSFVVVVVVIVVGWFSQYLMGFIKLRSADAEWQILLPKIISSPPLVEKFLKAHPNPSNG